MRESTVARSYAETLFELADRHEGTAGGRARADRRETVADGRTGATDSPAGADGQTAAEAFGEAVAAAALLCEDEKVREFLATPRIPAAAKKRALEHALGPSSPPLFLAFLKVVVDKGRQRLIPRIADEYRLLLDQRMGRRYVEVTVARPLDEAAVDELARRMSKATGSTVVPSVKVVPGILGGIVIRDGDTVYDGSLRRRLGTMRRRLMGAKLPVGAQPRTTANQPTTTNHRNE